ncbi:TonB-dependent receptor [Desulfovibrio sp.]|uniref:TonB-dependent receptor n=1 Tax=Desulfovibrio sp. TaxID=885 RepID=UPI0025C3E632|nr:TonB-dependent receptor [Desulfovibrio sp.]
MRYLSLSLAALGLCLSVTAATAKPGPAAPDYTLDAVTVTATKREQKVKDIATSISTATDLDLENAAAHTLKDATRLFPNVHMKSTSSGNEIVIRGFSTWDTALQSPAGLYVDEIPYPISYMQNLYLLDIDKVEVLRGPQGTLFGQNSESGVVNLTRRVPGDQVRAHIFTDAGTYNTYRLGAAASAPLLEDRAYFSGSFLRHQSDGYVDNLYKDSTRAARHESTSGRGMLRLTPTDRLDLRFSLDASRQEDGVGTMRLDTGPYRSNRWEVRSDAADSSSANFTLPALIASYMGDAVKLTSISSYTAYNYEMKSDIDRTPLPTGVSDMQINQRGFTQELRLASVGKSRLSWVTGTYLGSSRTETDMNRLMQRAVARSYLHTDYTSDTGALFGQSTWSIVEGLRLTLGLRAEHTRLNGEQTYRTMASRRHYTKDVSYTELLPMASLSWDATDNITPYISWSQGYLPGGFNVFSANNRNNFYYDPEYSTNYELGLKTHWLDDRLMANITAFYSSIRDKQVREEDPSGGVGTWKFTNSAQAHSSGLEAEIKAYPLPGLELRGGVGYARAIVDDWTTTVNGVKKDFSGKRLPWAPELTYNVGVGYTHETGLFAQVDLFGAGKQYFDAENTLSDSGYQTINAQIGYHGDNWDVSVWGKNVLDARYATKKLVAAGQTIVEDGAPMTFGVSVGWRF